MDQALRVPLLRRMAGLGTVALWLFLIGSASAQLPLETNGLRGGRYVGSSGAISPAPRVVAGLGYAYTEDVLQHADRHHRGFGELAAAYAPWRYLQLALAFSARYDAHRGSLGTDKGAAFATDLATRHALAITRGLSLGAQTRFRFPASASAGRGLRAVTPELGAIGSYTIAPGYELSVNAGYRFERTRESLRDPSVLSEADRLGAAISRYDAALLGLLFSLPTGPLTTSLEWSWDVALGGGAPSALEAPMRVRLASQAVIARRYVPGIELGVSPSARPPLDAGVRIEPRLWAALHFGVVFEPEPRPVTRTVRPAPVVAAVPEPTRTLLRVVDPSGQPIAGAEIAWAPGQTEPGLRTDAEGHAELTLTREEPVRATITREGFETQQVELDPAQLTGELTITLARTLPDGEIKGKVRSLRGGRPLVARIVVEPLGQAVETDASGNFRIDVPPGQYTLEISANGYEPQRRQAHVELRGVTILVVDLRRAAK